MKRLSDCVAQLLGNAALAAAKELTFVHTADPKPKLRAREAK